MYLLVVPHPLPSSSSSIMLDSGTPGELEADGVEIRAGGPWKAALCAARLRARASSGKVENTFLYFFHFFHFFCKKSKVLYFLVKLPFELVPKVHTLSQVNLLQPFLYQKAPTFLKMYCLYLPQVKKVKKVFSTFPDGMALSGVVQPCSRLHAGTHNLNRVRSALMANGHFCSTCTDTFLFHICYYTDCRGGGLMPTHPFPPFSHPRARTPVVRHRGPVPRAPCPVPHAPRPAPRYPLISVHFDNLGLRIEGDVA